MLTTLALLYAGGFICALTHHCIDSFDDPDFSWHEKALINGVGAVLWPVDIALLVFYVTVSRFR